MKLNKLTAAMGVAMIAASGSALAFNPGTTTADYEVVLSGATASTALTRNLLIDQICDSASAIDVFRRGNVGSFSNGWAVACRATFADGNGDGVNDLSAPANVLFTKRDSGGSGTGVGPVESSTLIDVLAVTTTGASPNCAPAGTDSTGAGTSFNQWSCGAANTAKVPDAGFSDIEPSKFVGINTPTVTVGGVPTPVPFQGLGNLEVRGLAGLAFNAPVNLRLRNALQAAQGLTVGSETEANMPSLPAGLIRALFTGAITNWDQVKVDNGSGTLVSLRQHPAVIAAEAPATPTLPQVFTAAPLVHVCRRVNGSGTQAQFNAIFLNWPCDQSVALPASEGGNPLNGPVIRENSGSSDVGRCLDDFSNGTNNSGENIAFGPQAANRTAWAIGVQSTEKNTGNTRDYRFIKVDGFAPTLKNVHAGNYFDFAEQSMQWRNDGSFNAAGNVADVTAILEFVAANATAPAAIQGLNLNFSHSWGQGGWLVVPNAANVPNPVLNLANPINTVSRQPLGQGPNTCQTPMAVSVIKAN